MIARLPANSRKLLLVGLLAVALVALSGGSASACWGWGCGYGWGWGWAAGCGWGWGGGWGCYSTCYRPCYYRCYTPCWTYCDPCWGVVIDDDDQEQPQRSAAKPLATTDGLLAIRVPDDTRVAINGHQTTSTGSYREYLSRNLKPGHTYPFQIHATRVVDGRTVEDQQVVYLRAGERRCVAMEFNQSLPTGLASTR